MKGMLRPVALLLVALMLAATCALAAAPEAGEDFYILDQAGVLSAGTKSAILEKNQSLNQSYGIQIVVVTVADLGSQGIQEYTQSILNQWKVGGDAQMGMVLVLDIAGENYYTIAGTGIRGKFTSAQLQELLDTYLEPGFAEGNYDDGVASYFAEVADYYTRENNDERQMMKLLYQSLRALCSPVLPNPLVQSVFELKAIAVNGEFPGIPTDRKLEESTIYALRYIVESPVEKLYTFTVAESV